MKILFIEDTKQIRRLLSGRSPLKDEFSDLNTSQKSLLLLLGGLRIPILRVNVARDPKGSSKERSRVSLDLYDAWVAIQPNKKIRDVNPTSKLVNNNVSLITVSVPPLSVGILDVDVVCDSTSVEERPSSLSKPSPAPEDVALDVWPGRGLAVVDADALDGGVVSDEDVLGDGVQLAVLGRVPNLIPVVLARSGHGELSQLELSIGHPSVLFPYVGVGGGAAGRLEVRRGVNGPFGLSDGDLLGENGEELPM